MANTWIVAELQQPMELFSIFTGRYPGTTLDAIAEHPREVAGDVIHPSVLLIRGAPPAAIDALIDVVHQTYGPPTTLRRNDTERVWLARLNVPESAFRDAGLAALTRFQHHWGMPWIHLEQGTFHLRARVQDDVDPLRLLRQVEGYLESQGIDAFVTVQEVSEHDFGVWRELVEHTVGMTN